jgi:hypothetical protein
MQSIFSPPSRAIKVSLRSPAFCGRAAGLKMLCFVQVYDYANNYVLMLARMYERRMKGYAAFGYVIDAEAFPPVPPTAARVPAPFHVAEPSLYIAQRRKELRDRPLANSLAGEGFEPSTFGL